MKSAGIAELKARLSEYIAEVRGGEEVLVTDRGLPVARLTPVDPVPGGMEDLRDLERAGIIRLPDRKPDLSWLDSPRARDPEGRSLRAVLREREEGW